MSAYYNEFDKKAAAWLRELIKGGHIAPGDVDERSIVDVRAADLVGYTQCHFFAGIGGWSLALRLAGWPDDEPVWTGSCPCQPFSAAGKQAEEEDPRHLWPHLLRLISESRPDVCFGEQVAGAAGLRWLSGVHVDLEAIAYRFGTVELCAASKGAPHIRQRSWWVADTVRGQREQRRGPLADARGDERRVSGFERSGVFSWLASAKCDGGRPDEQERELQGGVADGRTSGLVDAQSGGCGERGNAAFPRSGGHADGADATSRLGSPNREGSLPSAYAGVCGREEGARSRHGESERSGCTTGRVSLAAGEGLSTREQQAVLGAWRREEGRAIAEPCGTRFWDDYDIIPCLDGKARRVEAGTFPLAHGIPARVGRLRGYGNAIVPAVAAEFIQAYVEVK